MSDIDLKPLHPKNKLHLYSRYVLSKLSWHLTVAPLPKVWIVENIDSIVNKYIRKWLDVPISGTLSNVFLNYITNLVLILFPHRLNLHGVNQPFEMH